jgi:ABC-type polysaccharide/polyol phosphate export permease
VLRRRLRQRAARLFTSSNANLLRELAWANFQLSDHNSTLGALWGLLAPTVTLGVLWIVFGSHFGRGVAAYPLYLLVGIVTVGFFLTATRYLMTLFQTNRSVLLDSTVPRETLIASNLLPHIYKFGIELLLCIALSTSYGLLSWRIGLLLAPLVVAYVAFVLGVGFVLAIAHCFTSDVEHLWMIASRLLFFATPVFYTLDSLGPVAQRAVYWLNPVTPFVLAFRNMLLAGEPLDPVVHAHAFALGAASLLVGYGVLLRWEGLAVERA